MKRHAIKQEPNNVIANLRLGKIYQTKLNDYDSAIDCYIRIIESDPTHFKAFYQMGLCYVDKKDFKKASDNFRECLKINPKFAQAWKSIGKGGVLIGRAYFV